MSWEDQGRQDHGWFGNGTAPPKADEAGGDRFVLTPEALDQRIHAAIEAAMSAEAAGARAYVWAKAHGPALFGLPRNGVVLDAFADAVRRIERAKPGSILRALDARAARAATADGLLTPVRFTTDLDYACRALGLNREAASRALHAAKETVKLRGDENCTFNLDSGDILFNGESIGNLGD